MAERCKACGGSGVLMAECCDGSGPDRTGCPCRGVPVNLGPCRACLGGGWVVSQKPGVNAETVRRLAEAGGGFIGGFRA